ncbi:MAG: hypothetical protein M1826_006546 [Phylliscum demangeonii]|nr:MAG: hypothetical protein M1826_006546 [Phylliscum demangeonii]
MISLARRFSCPRILLPSHLPSVRQLRRESTAPAPASSATATATATALIVESHVAAPHLGHIKILSLNNPRTRNAISRALLAELRQHLDALHAEGDRGPTRALILASALDECFCSGADLKERASFSPDETEHFLARLRDTFSLLAELPIPTIAAVSSAALGGGLELALATDMRIFASTTVVGLPETKLGIIPGAGGTYRLPALIGETRAMDLILTGRRIRGWHAFHLGLCNGVVQNSREQTRDVDRQDPTHDKNVTPTDPPTDLAGVREKVLQRAVREAVEICEGAPLAVRAAKKAIKRWRLRESEKMAYDEVSASPDRDEGLRAFREKRTPVFTGLPAPSRHAS